MDIILWGSKMKIYDKNSMISSKDIAEINKQLVKLESKVPKEFLDGNEHALANVLSLACGGGTYGITSEKINSIKNNEFEIHYDCKGSITGPKKI